MLQPMSWLKEKSDEADESVSVPTCLDSEEYALLDSCNFLGDTQWGKIKQFHADTLQFSKNMLLGVLQLPVARGSRLGY